jgi:hypothetical protein
MISTSPVTLKILRNFPRGKLDLGPSNHQNHTTSWTLTNHNRLYEHDTSQLVRENEGEGKHDLRLENPRLKSH